MHVTGGRETAAGFGGADSRDEPLLHVLADGDFASQALDMH